MQIQVLSKTGGNLGRYLPFVTEDFQEFKEWIEPITGYIAHDLETTVHNSVLKREMLVSAYYYDDVAWVIFIPELTSEELAELCVIMSNKKFIIQASKFEYGMWKKFGVTLEKYHDIYLQDKLLYMGIDGERFDLSSILERHLGKTLDKSLQKSFVSCSTIDDAQLEYAVADIVDLPLIMEIQLDKVALHDRKFKAFIRGTKHRNRGLKKASWWTHEFSKVLNDMQYYGVGFNPVKWTELYHKSFPLVQAAKEKLNSIVVRDFKPQLIAAGMYLAKDKVVDKLFTSPEKKLRLFKIVFPDLEKTSNHEVTQYLKNNDPDYVKGKEYLNSFTKDKWTLLKLSIAGNFKVLESFFIGNFRDEMIKQDLLLPAGTLILNWASPDQRKEVFQWIHPGLESTDKEHMEEIAWRHELIQVFTEEYSNANNRITKFGLKYLDHIDEDGMIRTNIDPVLNTGRISSSKPNVLNIINDAEYRSAFIARPGFKMVGCDYNGQELVITALVSDEQSWIDAIRKNKDLHSMNARKTFSGWLSSARDDCQFAINEQKCKCPGHKVFRDRAKTVIFGIIYGITKFGLSYKIKASVDEAQEIINDFKRASPAVTLFFKKMAEFTVNQGYTPESGLGTARFIQKKRLVYDREAVMRESGNFNIQGVGAGILKVATSLIRRHINHNGFKDKAYIVLTPYDEIVMDVEDSIVEYWSQKLPYFMELAAKLVLGSDILTADKPAIENFWKH